MVGQGLKILLVSPEVVPFAKTGGLADVAGALPKALARLGHDVRVFLPYYRMVREQGFKPELVYRGLLVPISSRQEPADIYETSIDGRVPVYLLGQDKYYDRPELYRTPQGDYADNAERFIYFSRAALEMLKAVGFQPDVIHCNDWQTGLIPVYLKSLYREDGFFGRTGTLFTIHNIAYQGSFWHLDMHLTGLGWEYFVPDWIEFYGRINLLKAGILHADVVSTVSKKYSQEIQTPEYGHGLEGVLQARSNDLYGIVNGVDYSVFDPSQDKYIPCRYDAEHLEGKWENKRALQEEYGLPVADKPLIGIISRLDTQKGFDLVAEVIDEIMQLDLQLVLLGTGMEEFHTMFLNIAQKYPDKAGVKIAYDAKLAQLIYAGSDMFLMPSRYEPCGLGQLISLRYGTIPIVRATGGLVDTIQDYDPKTGEGNGFVFYEYQSSKLVETIRRALEVYQRREEWKVLMRRGMKLDFSWEQSAREYVKLYQLAVEK